MYQTTIWTLSRQMHSSAVQRFQSLMRQQVLLSTLLRADPLPGTLFWELGLIVQSHQASAGTLDFPLGQKYTLPLNSSHVDVLVAVKVGVIGVTPNIHEHTYGCIRMQTLHRLSKIPLFFTCSSRNTHTHKPCRYVCASVSFPLLELGSWSRILLIQFSPCLLNPWVSPAQLPMADPTPKLDPSPYYKNMFISLSLLHVSL